MLLRSLFAPAIFPNRAEAGLVREFLGKEPGIFIEVGANDPVRGSQSWALEQEGWSGLLVEPLAEKAKELRARRRAIVEEVACGPPELHGTFARLHVRDTLSTLAVERGDAGIVFDGERDVPVRTLDSLTEKAGIEHVDFLSIDVEGYEAEVIKGATLSRMRPRLILVEDKARHFDLNRLLVKAGYKRVRRTGVNSWYVPRSVPFPVPVFGRLQMLRKYYLAVPMHRMRDGLRRLGLGRRKRSRGQKAGAPSAGR
jgi:FkbM family methyltransferase